ncbi:MAG: complement resistance protein TraT [Candidatus Aenigmatarchaeota archaeon]
MIKRTKTMIASLISATMLCGTVYLSTPAPLQADVSEFAEAMRALGAVKSMNQIQPINLDPITREKIETVYIEVYDSSGLGIPTDQLQEKLNRVFEQKGYTVVNSPSEAGYVIQISLTNIYFGKEKKGTSGIGSNVLSAVGGYAGLVLGMGAGSIIGMQIGSAIGSSLGGAIGEKAEETVMDALTGKKYQFFGTFDVKVIENYETQKTYTGKYPIAGKGNEFSVEKFIDDLSSSIGGALSVFNKPARKD